MSDNPLADTLGGAQGNDGNGLDMSQLRALAWNQVEDKVFAFLNETVSEIDSKRGTQWKPREEASQTAEKVEGTDKEEDLIENGFGDVQLRFMRLLFTYMEHHQNPNVDASRLRNEVKKMIVELHNPETQEAILLAVKPEYRELMRDRVEEFGMALWGMYQLISGEDGDDKWYFLHVLSTMQDTSLKQVVQQVEGVTTDEIPTEYQE